MVWLSENSKPFPVFPSWLLSVLYCSSSTRELQVEVGLVLCRNEQTLKLILEESINNFTETDGLRLRCRQFSTSSKSPHHLFPASFKTSYHKVRMSNHLLSLRHSADQGRRTFRMAYLPKSGRLFFNRSKTMSPTARLQPIMVSHVKPSGGLFMLLVAANRHVLDRVLHNMSLLFVVC